MVAVVMDLFLNLVIFYENGQMKHHLLTSNLYNIINNINYIHCFKNWSHLETVKKEIYLE